MPATDDYFETGPGERRPKGSVRYPGLTADQRQDKREKWMRSLIRAGWEPSRSAGETVVWRRVLPPECICTGPGVELVGGESYASRENTTWYRSPIEGLNLKEVWNLAQVKTRRWSDDEQMYLPIWRVIKAWIDEPGQETLRGFLALKTLR